MPRTAAVWSIVAAATIMAAALRLPFLGHQSLWLDEVFTREVLHESSISGLWQHVKQTESTPPLFYVLGWLAGARSAVAMRLIPALALIAAVPVNYLATRRLVGQHVALASAAILAVSPLLVFYASDARSYGLSLLTALLSVWAFAHVLGFGSRARRDARRL
jgi:mannosyltransferase